MPYLLDMALQAGGAGDFHARSATHDISRTSFHVKHISQFAKRLEDVRHPDHLHGDENYLTEVLVGSSSISEPWTIITEVQEGAVIITTLEFGRSVCYPRVGGSRKMPTGRLFFQHRHLWHSV